MTGNAVVRKSVLRTLVIVMVAIGKALTGAPGIIKPDTIR